MTERIYIGSYADKISVCEFNNGNLQIINQVSVSNPSYLCINNDVLYSVCENKEGSAVSFKIDNNDLKKINSVNTNEALPCHISTDEHRTKLFISNYESGSVNIYNLEQDGKIGQNITTLKYENGNLHFAKCIGTSLYIVDLGNDKVYIYNRMKLQQELQLEPKSGPRHFVITDDNKNIFIVTELSNEIYHYCNEKFSLVEKISTLKNTNVVSYAGAIKLTKDNKNIYVTNRGQDTIAVFEIINNKLKLVQTISSYGKFPRDIFLDNTEEYVMVANQKSNNISVFKRNRENGILIKIENANVEIERPACIIGSSKNEI